MLMKLRPGFVFVVNGRPSKLSIVKDSHKDFKTQKWKFEPAPPEAAAAEPADEESESNVNLETITEGELRAMPIDALRVIYSQVFDASAPKTARRSDLVSTIWQQITETRASTKAS